MNQALRGTIRELDGLRGIAILLVILHHYWPAQGPWAAWGTLPHLGWIGVDLFFVVSGFLITGILLDTKNAAGFFRTFYIRRALRIFPLYYLFLALVFVAIPALQGGPWAQSEFVRQSGSPWWYLLYQGNLREALVGHEPAYVLAPLWSLAIEEQFYLLWPFLVSSVSRVRLRPILTATIGLALLYRVMTLLVWPANERVQYLATPARMDVLAIGALLALGLRDGWLRIERPLLTRATLAGLALLAATFALGGLDRNTEFGRTLGYSVVGLSFGLVVLWAVTGRETAETGWLRWTPLRALGKVCYGVYILQRPMEVVVGKLTEVMGIPWDRTALWTVPVLMAVTFATAALSWFAFEKPVLGLKRHFTVLGHPQATTAP
ncbi:MAG: acyltransferase [Gemmatimonadota bacterium]